MTTTRDIICALVAELEAGRDVEIARLRLKLEAQERTICTPHSIEEIKSAL